MKSQNSEVYFICYNIEPLVYWYGKYDCVTSKFSWAAPKPAITDLLFIFDKPSEHSYITFEELVLDFFIIHQQSTPFDLAYLQTYYPELLI